MNDKNWQRQLQCLFVWTIPEEESPKFVAKDTTMNEELSQESVFY